MGVKGLQTYIESNCPEACYFVNIRGLVDTYTRETGREAVIVVDGGSCLRHLYGSLEWVQGGQLKEFVDIAVRFVEAFQAIGTRLIIYFDGATVERKRPEWVRRRLQNMRDVFKIYDCLNRWQKSSYVNHNLFQLPASLGSIARFIFKHVCGCEVRTSLRECDEEIAEYARNENCFAILGQDTDYIIYEGAQYYFSIRKLNLRNMTTLNYNRWAFARSLGLRPEQLPLLATLLGNDLISTDELRSFHLRLCEPIERKPYSDYSKIRFDILIKRVSDFVRRQPFGPAMFQSLPNVAYAVFEDKGRARDLDTSIRSYNSEKRVSIYEKAPNSDWDHLLEMAKSDCINCNTPPQIWAIMSGLPYEASTAMEDFRKDDLPPTALVMRPLRQRIYGLLLREKPRPDDEPTIVLEWCMHGEDSLRAPAEVRPVNLQGCSHPGLKTLWGPGNDVIKWEVFSAAISPRLDPGSLRNLPPQMVVPTAVLYYLCHEPESQLFEKWEVEAILAHCVALREYSASQLAALDVSTVDVRAIRIATLFMRGTRTVLLLLATCGYPISMEQSLPWHYFDGKLFNLIYQKTKIGVTYEEHCQHKVSLMEDFSMMRSIIFDRV